MNGTAFTVGGSDGLFRHSTVESHDPQLNQLLIMGRTTKSEVVNFFLVSSIPLPDFCLYCSLPLPVIHFCKIENENVVLSFETF